MSRELTETEMMALAVQDASEIAETVRRNWALHENESERNRKAATLLLILADEVMRLRPDVREELETAPDGELYRPTGT